MKAFLMYPDRDFDRGQLLARRDRELRYRDADQAALDLRHLLPWNADALIQDLGLEQLFEVMADGDKFLYESAIVGLLSSAVEPEIIRYRQRVLADCFQNEVLIRDIYRIAIETIEEERKNHSSYFARYPSGIVRRSTDVLKMFVSKLKLLREIADRRSSEFSSDGFTRLFAMLREELSDSYFDAVESRLRQLEFRGGVLISANLGQGNKGTNYVPRTPPQRRPWFARLFAKDPPGYTFRLHPRDEAGARALSALNDRGLNLIGDALGRSADHILSFFQMLRTELAFYIATLNLHARLREIQITTCMPAPILAGRRTMAFADLIDVSLALSAGKKVVGNDFKADEKDLVIITGANTGGKSTFLRSVGLAALMMQAGIFVTARSFSAEICEGVFTHYRRKEDTTMESGKWDEELNRMSAVVDHLKPDSLMLFNESFASTNEREGSEIATQIVRALLEKRVKIFFVTHLYHFANTFYERPHDDTKFLRAERRADGTRPFKLIEGPPLQTSYGPDLYESIFAGAHLTTESEGELAT